MADVNIEKPQVPGLGSDLPKYRAHLEAWNVLVEKNKYGYGLPEGFERPTDVPVPTIDSPVQDFINFIEAYKKGLVSIDIIEGFEVVTRGVYDMIDSVEKAVDVLQSQSEGQQTEVPLGIMEKLYKATSFALSLGLAYERFTQEDYVISAISVAGGSAEVLASFLSGNKKKILERVARVAQIGGFVQFLRGPNGIPETIAKIIEYISSSGYKPDTSDWDKIDWSNTCQDQQCIFDKIIKGNAVNVEMLKKIIYAVGNITGESLPFILNILTTVKVIAENTWKGSAAELVAVLDGLRFLKIQPPQFMIDAALNFIQQGTKSVILKTLLATWGL
jgi:hypothetical protein